MKNFAICAVASGLAFVFMGYQSGLFDGRVAEPAKAPAPEKKKVEKARFPHDLAPAARAYAVAAAAPFMSDAEFYPMVFLKTNGALYQRWQDRLDDGWATQSVEETQLAVILGAARESFVDITHYKGGAPPVRRYKNELEVSVVEARTGKVLANRLFVTMPRPIKRVESWELTKIGEPVAFKTVYNWVVFNARANFPEPTSPHPLVTISD